MKSTLRRPLAFTALAALLGASALSASGCGVIKSRDEHVVTASQAGVAAPTGDAEEEEIRQIKEFLDLYTDHGNLTREGLANLFNKYQAQLQPYLQGMGMTSQQLIDLIFDFDANHDGQITPQELSDGLMNRIPILRWIPDNKTEITRAQLDQSLAQEYPGSSAVARSGLGDALMRFDETWAGGDADGKLSRFELSGAGIVLGMLGQTDFSHGFTVPPGVLPPVDTDPQHPGTSTISLSPIVGKIIQQKVDQQLFGRYAVHSSSELPPGDLKLEWMQLGMKFMLADKLVHRFAPTEGVSAGKLPLGPSALSALALWGEAEPDHVELLTKLYDNAIMGGDGDGSFSSIEAFNYLTDLDFACKLRAALGGSFSYAAVSANPRKTYLLSVLLKLFPRSGEALFMNDLDQQALSQWGLRKDYWDGFKATFDKPVNGGSGTGKLDDGDVAMGMLIAKTVENLYELYNVPHDTYLVRAEGDKLFATLGIYDSRIIDAFYANVGLETGSPTFWQKLKLFFGGPQGWTWLRPYDFEVRLVEVMPQLLNREGL